MAKFLGRNPRRKYVRPIPNSSAPHKIIEKVEKMVEEHKENNEVNIEKNMEDERLEKIEAIVGTKAPKRKIKVEKKDKGLFERTENSTILLTEDNKMVLTD